MRRVTVVAAGLLVASGAVMAAETNTVYEMGEVVVIARVPQPAQEIPASVGVISHSNIVNRTPISLTDVIRDQPGVGVQGSGYPGATTKPVLRGQSPGLQSKRVLVLRDGRRTEDPYQDAVEFALLPADGLERVEVLKGPASALYGSDAEAGVINMVSRRGTEVPDTWLRAAAGSYSLQHYQAEHGWAFGPVDYHVAGSYLDTDGYTDNEDGTDRDWNARNVAGNIGWQITDDAALRTYLGAYSGEGTDDNFDREVDRHYEQLDYTWTWDREREADLLLRAYYTGDDQIYDWKFPGEGDYDLYTAAGEVQQSLWVTESQRVTGGAELREQSVDITDVTGPIDESATTKSAYLQDEIQVHPAVRLTAGARGDHQSEYGTEYSPRVAALWQVTEQSELFTSYNRAHRAPSLSDRYVRAVYNGMEFIGNPDLDPETLTAYELGGRCRHDSGAAFELTTFYNDLEDSFEFAMAEDGVFRNRNVGHSWTYGFELGATAPICGALSAFANYTWTDGEYDEFGGDPEVEGNTLQYLARNTMSAGLAFDDRRVGYHALSARYVDDRYGDDRNTAENRLDDYITVDWRSRVQVCANAWLTLNVDNIFDTSYESYPGVEQPGVTVIGGIETRL